MQRLCAWSQPSDAIHGLVQALPLKLLAVGAFTGVVNLPSGAARVHVEKFSPGWFVAVHATIPFIALLRKALLMPKWAVIYTIGSAVMGQLLGARLERQRLEAQLRSNSRCVAAPVDCGQRRQTSLSLRCQQESLVTMNSTVQPVAAC